MPITYTL